MESRIAIEEIKQMIERNELTQSLEILNRQIHAKPNDAEELLLRARILYRMQKWGDAMNDFGAVLDIDPHNAEAKAGLEMARNILGYFTPDMFNP
jgi:cytochrome c-type biogenesis protein CcmH/NrfG